MIRASIKNLEIRSMRRFLGHEQEELYQGDIYYKGKKIGWYSDDSWGGCAIIDVQSAHREIIENIAKVYLPKLYPNHSFLWSSDILFSEIITLNLNAKFFEQQQKTGRKFVGEFSNNGAFASGRVVASDSIKWLESYAKANQLTLGRIFKEPADFQIA